MWYEPCLVPGVVKEDMLRGIWAKAVGPSGEVTSGSPRLPFHSVGRGQVTEWRGFFRGLSFSQNPNFDSVCSV